MNLVDLLQIPVHQSPETIALWDSSLKRPRCLTFAQLDAQVQRVAIFLQRQHLQPGQGVLILHPLSAELYIILGALFRLGLVALFLDPAAGIPHINHCCRLFPPHALIATSKAYSLLPLSAPLRRIPLKIAIGPPIPDTLSWHHLPPPDHKTPAPVDLTPDSPALLTFTSGSTGQPKAALRSHGFLLHQYHILKDILTLQPGQIDLCTLPIFILANLAAGVTSIIPPGNLKFLAKIDPKPVLRQIERHQVTRLVASPAFLDRLSHYSHQHHLTFPSLQKVFMGGAPIFPPTVQALQQMAPQAALIGLYGSTEAEPMARVDYGTVSPQNWQKMAAGGGLLLGKPVLNLAIIPPRWGEPLGPFTVGEFQDHCLPPHQAGEIVVSGDHVLGGYWRGYGNPTTKFRVGEQVWHRTGDMGYRDNEGQLWLLGRCVGCVADEQGILYPLGVAGVLAECPAVVRSFLLSRRGQRVLVLELSPKGWGLKSFLWRLLLSFFPRFGIISRHQSSDWPPHPLLTPYSPLRPFLARLDWAHFQQVQIVPHIPVDPRHNAKVDYGLALKKF
ncbi:AMP-binding protein [Spirulina subsalsa]|uniref:AMP-binding protein n=1 Tax=Spirulina subsalsa TaxID=54311 RepID=UPI0002FC36CE